jgi:hypothetical protein
VLGDILIEPLTPSYASAEDNDIGVDEIDDVGECPGKALFISGHGGLGQGFTPICRRHDFGPRPTLPPGAKVICGKPRT